MLKHLLTKKVVFKLLLGSTKSYNPLNVFIIIIRNDQSTKEAESINIKID